MVFCNRRQTKKTLFKCISILFVFSMLKIDYSAFFSSPRLSFLQIFSSLICCSYGERKDCFFRLKITKWQCRQLKMPFINKSAHKQRQNKQTTLKRMCCCWCTRKPLTIEWSHIDAVFIIIFFIFRISFVRFLNLSLSSPLLVFFGGLLYVIFLILIDNVCKAETQERLNKRWQHKKECVM